MTPKETCQITICCVREMKKQKWYLSQHAKAVLFLDDRITELESQRDGLLAACKMALKRKPFPVGWIGLKETLEDAVARAEEI